MCGRLPGSYCARWELRNGGSAPRRNAGYFSSLLLVFFFGGEGNRESVTLLIVGCLGNSQCGLETPQTGLHDEGEGLWYSSVFLSQ